MGHTFKVQILTQNLDDKFVDVYHQETADIINEVSGKNMSWYAYEQLIENLIKLDHLHHEEDK